MRIRKDFEDWLARLCDYYSRGDWFTPENVDACWRDIRGVELDALEDIGQWIRTKYTRWGDGFSVSAAIHKAWTVIEPERVRARRLEDVSAQTTYRPLTQEEADRGQRMCQDIIRALRTNVAPPWAGKRSMHDA